MITATSGRWRGSGSRQASGHWRTSTTRLKRRWRPPFSQPRCLAAMIMRFAQVSSVFRRSSKALTAPWWERYSESQVTEALRGGRRDSVRWPQGSTPEIRLKLRLHRCRPEDMGRKGPVQQFPPSAARSMVIQATEGEVQGRGGSRAFHLGGPHAPPRPVPPGTSPHYACGRGRAPMTHGRRRQADRPPQTLRRGRAGAVDVDTSRERPSHYFDNVST